MRQFIVDLERVIVLEVPNDRHAAQVADHIDSAIDQAIRDCGGELQSRHTQAYRGTRGGLIYDSEDESVRP